MLIPLSATAASTEIAIVGGKGHSLMRLREMGLAVPDGLILTTDFFAPWYDALRKSAAWTTLGQGSLRDICASLGREAKTLSFSPAQEEALRAILPLVGRSPSGRLAARSSSPGEDLKNASFAGEYRSVLGLSADGIEAAVRECFLSSLSESVFTYKATHGFDLREVRLAVIFQHQLDSEVAGVAFSLNPTTNDYDEAVITANWGQGESVVSGAVTPDRYVVDKPALQLRKRTLGDKENSVWLGDSSTRGLVCKPGFQSDQWTLTDRQVREITEQLIRIEEHEGHPVDVEWACAKDRVYFLQVRPITAYVPLPASLQTPPGERRRLYFDAGLMEGATVNAPLSQLSLSLIADFAVTFEREAFGNAVLYHSSQPEESLLILDGCRTYANLSNTFWISRPKQLVHRYQPMDVIASQILKHVDSKRYRSERKPRALRWLRLRALWAFRGLTASVVKACWRPRQFRSVYDARVRAFEARFEGPAGAQSAEERHRENLVQFSNLFLHLTMPAIIVYWYPGRNLVHLLFRRAPAEIRKLAEKLDQGLPDELIVKMGIALDRLGERVNAEDFKDLPRLVERVQRREMPEDFLEEWDAFVKRFGSRGPQEMELSNPRYGDSPLLLLEHVRAVHRGATRPAAIHDRHLRERHEAHQQLDAYLRRRWWRRWKRLPLRWAFHLITTFGGTRENPKHHLTLLGAHARQTALAEGGARAARDDLARSEDIFELTVSELYQSRSLPASELRSRIQDQSAFCKLLQAKVRNFPHLIDSRGRILQPPQPRPNEDGVFVGTPVSSGRVRGKIRVLRRPDASALQEGEILVAYVTDPGWTPLFVNAVAILLEVGGPLQHGALVAREYGKPCVVGIHDITGLFQDGQVVEVDGGTGTVRLLEDAGDD